VSFISADLQPPVSSPSSFLDFISRISDSRILIMINLASSRFSFTSFCNISRRFMSHAASFEVTKIFERRLRPRRCYPFAINYFFFSRCIPLQFYEDVNVYEGKSDLSLPFRPHCATTARAQKREAEEKEKEGGRGEGGGEEEEEEGEGGGGEEEEEEGEGERTRHTLP